MTSGTVVDLLHGWGGGLRDVFVAATRGIILEY